MGGFKNVINSSIYIVVLSALLIGCENPKDFKLASESISGINPTDGTEGGQNSDPGNSDNNNGNNSDPGNPGDPGNGPGDVVIPDTTPVFVESCSTLDAMQPKEQITKKVDIIIVTDTSGSLNQERAAIADGIDSFIEGLGDDVDYRIGVMLAHAESQYAGALYKASDEDAVLDSQKLSKDQIRRLVERKLTNVRGESVTDGGEAGLYSLAESFKGEKYAMMKDAGMYRQDAALGVIFVSDENDICATYPEGVTPVVDGNNKEIPAYDKFCKNKLDQVSAYKQLKIVSGNRPLVVSSIIYTDPNRVPSGGENEVGYGLLEIAKLNNGKLIDMRDDNIAQGLKDVGELTQSRLNLITEFKLNIQGKLIPDSIKAYVDDMAVDFQFEDVTGSVFLDKDMAGMSESKIKIDYCSLIPKSE